MKCSDCEFHQWANYGGWEYCARYDIYVENTDAHNCEGFCPLSTLFGDEDNAKEV